MRQVKQPGKKTTCPQRSDATTTAKGPSRKRLSRNSCQVELVPETLEYPLRTEAGIFRHTLPHLISFKLNKNPNITEKKNEANRLNNLPSHREGNKDSNSGFYD